jgi:hypothetical protein
MNQTMDVSDQATATARALFEAFFERRREDAELLIGADFTFTSPYDDAIDRSSYFSRCWPGGDRFLDFRIERTAEDADGGVLIHPRAILGWIGENERQLRSYPVSS